MHRFQTAYTVYFNRHHQQSGHLMQGRFGAALIDTDEYILKLSRYVHLNPVYIAEHRDKTPRERVDILRRYIWSSYRSYIGKVKLLDFVDYTPIISMMGRIKRKRPSVYRRFVESGIRDIDAAFIESRRRSRLCIGSDAFHEHIEKIYEKLVDGRDSKEDASFRRVAHTYPMNTVLDCVCKVMGIDRSVLTSRRRDSLMRPIAARALCDHAGMTQRQVAEVFDLSSGGAVSKQLARLSEMINKDKTLQKKLADIDRTVRNCR